MKPEMLTFRWFAKAYGWTPDQVRSLTLEEIEQFPLIEQAFDECARIRERQAQNSGGHHHGHSSASVARSYSR